MAEDDSALREAEVVALAAIYGDDAVVVDGAAGFLRVALPEWTGLSVEFRVPGDYPSTGVPSCSRVMLPDGALSSEAAADVEAAIRGASATPSNRTATVVAVLHMER